MNVKPAEECLNSPSSCAFAMIAVFAPMASSAGVRT